MYDDKAKKWIDEKNEEMRRLGPVGEMRFMPIHKFWGFIWKIKERLGSNKGTGIPVVVTDKVHKDKTIVYFSK